MTAVLLALVTAVTYGVANYLGPLLGRRLPLGSVLLAGQAGALTGAVVVALVEGLPHVSGHGLSVCLLAGVANAGGLLGFYRAGQVGDLSVVAPIGATGAVVPVLYALATGERPGAVALLGIPVALVGVVLAARRPPGGGERGAAAVVWALAGAAAFGAFLTVYARAQHYGGSAALLYSRLALLATVVVGVLVARAPVRVPVRAALPAVVPGLLLVTGTYAFGQATSRGLVSLVSVIATMSPVVTVGLALAVLHERLGRAQQLGAALALGGVVLIAVG